MRVIIDRLEGDKAVVELENGRMITVDKELFGDIKEGDAIEIKKVEKDESSTDTHSIFQRLRKKSENSSHKI